MHEYLERSDGAAAWQAALGALALPAADVRAGVREGLAVVEQTEPDKRAESRELVKYSRPLNVGAAD